MPYNGKYININRISHNNKAKVRFLDGLIRGQETNYQNNGEERFFSLYEVIKLEVNKSQVGLSFMTKTSLYFRCFLFRADQKLSQTAGVINEVELSPTIDIDGSHYAPIILVRH